MSVSFLVFLVVFFLMAWEGDRKVGGTVGSWERGK